jgi:hypothetical protein
MSYFNHAFKKTFVATNGISALDGVQLGTSTTNMLAAGEVTFIDPTTFLVYPDPQDISCCDLILGGGSLMQKDKIGPFAGGYLESNKSKTVRSKYVSKLYYAASNVAQRYITHVGLTPWTDANPPSSSNPGETGGDCCKQFLCGETYYLRVDVKGSPALRLLNHNSYLTLEAYTGCCPDTPEDPAIAPIPTDPVLVYIQWANQLLASPLMNGFVYPVVIDNNLDAWYPPGTPAADVIALGGVGTWDNYSSPAGPYDTNCGGLVLNGAYYETQFNNCTFQVTDFYEVEPLRVYASEVDLNGAPCEFQALCVGVECYGRQANGLGETVVRDVILSESYRQNHFSTDFRIREITQGYDILNAAGVSRLGLYDRIYLQHNVPRLYNPTGTFDNDQYLLEIVVPVGDPKAIFLALSTWLTACNSPCAILDTPLGVPCDVPLVPIPGDAIPVPPVLP